MYVASKWRVDDGVIELRRGIVRRLYSVVIPSIDTVCLSWNAAVVFPGSFILLAAHIRLSVQSWGLV